MKKIELNQKTKILLIALLALCTQVFFITPAYALEEDKQQDTVLVDEVTEESPNIYNKVESSESNDNQEEILEQGKTVQSASPTDDSLSNNTSINNVEDKEQDDNNLKGESLTNTNDNNKEETNNNNNNNNVNNNENNKVEVIGNTKAPTRAEDPTDLTNFITSVTINNTDQDEHGNYIVRKNHIYQMTMTFEEGGDKPQFNNHNELYYKLPDGFQEIENKHDGTIDITVSGTSQGDVVVSGNTYTIEDGWLRVKWNENDPHINDLFAANNASFSINFRGSFTGDILDIIYSDNVHTQIIIDDTTSSVLLTKDSNTEKYPDKIEYKIKLVSTGTNYDVDIDDVLSGNGVTLDKTSFIIPVDHTLTFDENNSNAFHLHFDRLSNGQEVIITYYALLDESFAEAQGSGANTTFVIDANNKVNLSIEDELQPPEPEHETNDKVTFSPQIYKVGKTIDGNHILWNITINANNKLLIKDMPVIDLIKTDSTGKMYYDLNTDTKIKVKIYNKSNVLVREEEIPLVDILNSSQTGWTYVIPSDDQRYRYEIEYTTSYYDQALDTTLTNDVEIGYNESSAGVDIEGYADIDLEKVATNVNPDDLEVTWEITIDIPAVGLDGTNNVLKDDYPSTRINDQIIYEKVIRESIVVDGLNENESYSINYNDSDHYVTITFFKDENQTIPGLKDRDK